MDAIIPQHIFDSMPPFMLLIVAAAAIYFLIKGADILVEGAAGIALHLGVSKIIIGATIVSLGTTSPEAAVSVMAAFSGNSGLALGNGVGSVIADTAFIFGLGALLATLPADRSVLQRQGWIQFGSAALLAIICYAAYAAYGNDAVVGRPIGILLTTLLVVYIGLSIHWSRRDAARLRAQGVEAEISEEIDAAALERTPVWRLALEGVVGLVLVIFASQFVVGSATTGAARLGIPDVVIASTIVAMGTSLPELVVGITAVLRGQKELLIGNVIGADILNILFVIGLSAVAADLSIVDTNPDTKAPLIFLTLHLPAMLIILAVFRLFIFQACRKGHFSRWMGVPLIAMYVTYLVLNYTLTGEVATH